jgi:hypothetical protein
MYSHPSMAAGDWFPSAVQRSDHHHRPPLRVSSSSGNILSWTFSEHLVNIQWTFSEPPFRVCSSSLFSLLPCGVNIKRTKKSTQSSHIVCGSYWRLAYVMMPPTRAAWAGVVFRIDFRMSGCWLTAREGEAYHLEEGGGLPANSKHRLGHIIYYSVISYTKVSYLGF